MSYNSWVGTVSSVSGCSSSSWLSPVCIDSRWTGHNVVWREGKGSWIDTIVFGRVVDSCGMSVEWGSGVAVQQIVPSVRYDAVESLLANVARRLRRVVQ